MTRRVSLVVSLIAVVAAPGLGAQLGALLGAQLLRPHDPVASPPASAPAARPRIGYAAPPAPVATPPERRVMPGPVYIVSPVYYYTADGFLVGAPYVVLSDGSVLVNFGGGYERVLRACALAQPSAPVDPWARDALGRIPEPPGIAAMRSGTRGTAVGVAPSPNTAACYRSSPEGRLEVAVSGAR